MLLMILGFFFSVIYVFFIQKPNWERTIGKLISKDMVIMIDSNHSIIGPDYHAQFLFKAKNKDTERKIKSKIYAINSVYPDDDNSGEFFVESEFGVKYSSCFSINGQETFFGHEDVVYKVYISRNGLFYVTCTVY